MKKPVLVLVIVLLALLALPALPVMASDPPPDDVFVKEATVFPDLLEDGDAFFVFHVDLDYSSMNGTYPSTPASIAILFRFYDTDNTTLLATTHPYVFPLFDNNGYGDLITSFYFPAADNITWGGAYSFNVFSLPEEVSHISPAINTSYPLGSSDWSAAPDQDTSRAELYTEILNLCDVFNTIYTTIDMKQTAGSSQPRLSEYGEAYFAGATPGLSALCPELFLFQEYVPVAISVTPYNTDLQDQYTARMAGSDIKRGLDRIGTNYFGGISGLFVAFILVFVASILICVFTMKQGWGIEPGMMAGACIVILAAILFGDTIFAAVMIGALLAAMALMWVLFLRRA